MLFCIVLFLDYLTSQQTASHGQICLDKLTCCHTDTEVADQTCQTPSNNILTICQPVQTLTLKRQTPGRVAAKIPMLKSLACHNQVQQFVVCLFACLTSRQQASVSQGRICSDNVTCCHTEIEVADQTFYLTQSQYTDTGPTRTSADPITPGAWQGSHWSANF